MTVVMFLLLLYLHQSTPHCAIKVVDVFVKSRCSVLQQLRSLIAVNETLKKQESEFRESCKVLLTSNLRGSSALDNCTDKQLLVQSICMWYATGNLTVVKNLSGL